MKFDKPAKSFDEQLDLLIERGLIGGVQKSVSIP